MPRGGRRPQASGKFFEMWLDGQHEYAQRLGVLAHAEHTQARARIVGGRPIYAAPGVADYVLCLAGGIYGAAEAKATEGSKLDLSRVAPLQRRHLDAVAGAGGLALLLAEFREPTGDGGFAVRRFAVPWMCLPRGVKSVLADDLAAWKVAEPCYLLRFIKTGGHGLPPASGRW